jgi:3-dehydroquinate synthase
MHIKHTLNVDLDDRSYPIYIGTGLLDQADLIRRHVNGRSALVVTNSTVAPLYLEPVQKALDSANIRHDELILEDGEQHKTLASVLLSQVDSSVGGKTGVNHPLGKNMIGAFFQPKCVIADIGTLNTLPARELSAGLAEVIKYGLICDADFFKWLEDNITGLSNLDQDLLAQAVLVSCQNKARVVEQDERESGLRAILNLGHTFGHAIETVMGYGKWLHGEAVAVGMVMAIDLSIREGRIDEGVRQRSVALLQQAGLPVIPPKDISVEQYLNAMSIDKKAVDGQIKLVLLTAIGEAFVSADYNQDKLLQTLNA